MRYTKKILFWSIIVILLAFLGTWAWIKLAAPYELPPKNLSFKRLIPPQSHTVYDGDNNPLHYLNLEEPIRFYRPIQHFDPKLKSWVVMLEDAKFYQHKGFDLKEINNSILKNLKEGKISRGASTITQQLAKNVFLDRKRSWARKFFEVPWTLKLEEELSKNQILELYLNYIEWGPNISGAESASRYFFGKSSTHLSVGEAMYLALMIPSPQRFDLISNPENIDSMNKKKAWLVDRLINEKKIDPIEKDIYLNSDFGIKQLDDESRAYPAPRAQSFRAHESVNFLSKMFSERRNRTSIVVSVQQLGQLPEYWYRNDEEIAGYTTANKDTVWCAMRGAQIVGFWPEWEDYKPSPELAPALDEYNAYINRCANNHKALVY